MSVLYKALQKAEKENELRQSASEASFDPHALAASGALKFAGSRGAGVNRVAMAAIVLVAVLGGGAFLIFKDSLMPVPAPQAARVPAASPAPAPVLPPPAESPTESSAPESAVAEDTSAPAPSETVVAEAAPFAAAPSVPAREDGPVAPLVAAAPARSAAKPAARPPAPPRAAEPMPVIAPDSPARMLSPPIAINRAEFALAGVGSQVQVREVSQSARSNVNAGYEALVSGAYDTALGFYDRALADEPNSILALLGRGAALQKLGRSHEAQGAYDRVLRLDPENREALTNVTAIVGERSPQDALARLLELEQQYSGFSPIKAQIGLTYARMGTMPQALDYLRRAVALSPEAMMYRYNLALVLDHLGRRDEAAASYETVLAAIATGRGPAELAQADIERRVRFLRAR